jgi:Spy/CpxP family protein refolding chaperone
MAWTWKKTLGAGAAGVLVLGGAAALTGFAGGACGHGFGPHGRDPAAVAALVTDRVDDALDDLDATPEQRARIHAVKDRLLAAAGEARSAGGDHRAELLAAWRSESPDAARLHALVDQHVDALRAAAHSAVDGAVEVHGTLTPAQREKLAAKAERRTRR